MLYKYPRIHHVFWSPNVHNDDRMHSSLSFFIGRDVIVTAKMDGESCSMYRDNIHARALELRHHESRNWVKSLHGRIKGDIPEGWRLCGENMYATHSIHYEHLPDYFFLFSVWDNRNVALSWDETIKWASLLDLQYVPLICEFTWENEAQARAILDQEFEDYCALSKDPVEGYVIRIRGEIPYDDYTMSTAKWVRKEHVQTDEHWMSTPIIPNKLALNQ